MKRSFDILAIGGMANDTTIPELEETLETALIARLASVCTIPVEGMLAPALVGTEKRLTADTFVGVKVDQSSQDGDYAFRAPFTFSAVVTVHYAQADDASGSDFRDECRRVRANLGELMGDGCSALNVAGAFDCAAFVLDSTSTNFEGGDNPVFTKSYSATIKGRQLTTTEASNG